MNKRDTTVANASTTKHVYCCLLTNWKLSNKQYSNQLWFNTFTCATVIQTTTKIVIL